MARSRAGIRIGYWPRAAAANRLPYVFPVYCPPVNSATFFDEAIAQIPPLIPPARKTQTSRLVMSPRASCACSRSVSRRMEASIAVVETPAGRMVCAGVASGPRRMASMSFVNDSGISRLP